MPAKHYILGLVASSKYPYRRMSGTVRSGVDRSTGPSGVRAAHHGHSMVEEAREIFDLRNEANKSFAINETTIMLCRILQSNRGAGVERRSCRTGTRCSGSSRLPGREALATDVQRGDL
jgi:plasmid stability protein